MLDQKLGLREALHLPAISQGRCRMMLRPSQIFGTLAWQAEVVRNQEQAHQATSFRGMSRSRCCQLRKSMYFPTIHHTPGLALDGYTGSLQLHIKGIITMPYEIGCCNSDVNNHAWQQKGCRISTAQIFVLQSRQYLG